MGLLSRKRLVTWLFLLLLVAVALNAYIWYQAKERADQFAGMMRPFAQITYDGIVPSLLGQVSFRGVEVRPRGINDEVRIDRITFSASNLLELIRLERDLQAGRIPKSMRLSMEGIRLETRGAIIEALYDMQASSGSQPDALNAALGACGDGQPMDADDWFDMGYHILVADIEYAYVHDPRFDSITLSGKTGVRDAASVSWDLRLTSMPLGQLTPVGLMGQTPRVEEIDFRYTDLSYNARRNRFCAERAGLDVDAFVDQHVASVHAELNGMGLEPSEGLVRAYRDFVSDARTIEFKAYPSSSVNFSSVGFYGPQELVDALGIRLHVNDQPVRDVGLARHQGERRTARPGAESGTPAVADQAQPAGAGTTPQFRPVEFDELDRHLDRSARVHLSNGREREGRLVVVEEGRLVLRQRMHGGNVSYPLTFAEIDRVEIFH